MGFISNLGVHTTYLQNFALSYVKDKASNIVMALPTIYGNKTDTYYQFDSNMVAFQDERKQATINSSKDKPNKVETEYIDLAHTIKPYAEMITLSEDDIAESEDAQINQIEDSLALLLTRAHAYETLDVRDKMVDTSIFAHSQAGTKWGAGTARAWDTSGGDPERDINEAFLEASAKSGGAFEPNTIALSKRAFNAMFLNENIQTRTNSVIVDLFKQQQWLRDRTNIQNIIQVENFVNTAKPGKTPVMEAVMGGDVWIGYLPNTPTIGKKAPSALARATLKYGKYNDFGIQVSILDKRNGAIFDDGTSGVTIVVKVYTNPIVIAKDLGYIVEDVLTVTP